MQQHGKLEFHDDEVTYTYKDVTYGLFHHPFEPCLYIYNDDDCICTLHNAFTTYRLKEAFTSGGTVSDYDREYDEEVFCRVLAAALDSERTEMDFFYAAKLVKEA